MLSFVKIIVHNIVIIFKAKAVIRENLPKALQIPSSKIRSCVVSGTNNLFWFSVIKLHYRFDKGTPTFRLSLIKIISSVLV